MSKKQPDEIDAAVVQTRPDARILSEILHLFQHINLGELVVVGQRGIQNIAVPESPEAPFAMPEPRIDVRHCVAYTAAQEGFHRAASAMAAEDDIFDAERNKGVFNGSGGGVVAVITRIILKSGNQVADVPQFEQIPRHAGGEQGRHDAAIRAGDEEFCGTLAVREFREERFNALCAVRIELMQTIHERFEGGCRDARVLNTGGIGIK